MWRYDATPARVPAALCGASEPHTARAVVGNEPRRAVPSAPAGRMEVEIAAGQHVSRPRAWRSSAGCRGGCPQRFTTTCGCSCLSW